LRGRQKKLKLGPGVAEKRMSAAAPTPLRKSKAKVLAFLYVNISQLKPLTSETIRKPTTQDALVLSQSIYNDNKVSIKPSILSPAAVAFY